MEWCFSDFCFSNFPLKKWTKVEFISFYVILLKLKYAHNLLKSPNKGQEEGKEKRRRGDYKGEGKPREPVLAPLMIFHDLGVVSYPLSDSRFFICEVGINNGWENLRRQRSWNMRYMPYAPGLLTDRLGKICTENAAVCLGAEGRQCVTSPGARRLPHQLYSGHPGCRALSPSVKFPGWQIGWLSHPSLINILHTFLLKYTENC